MGQWGQTNLGYGLIAATLAEMTGGLVLSDDNAWDYARFPATGSEMFDWYFRPEKALADDKREWAVLCIKSIRAHPPEIG